TFGLTVQNVTSARTITSPTIVTPGISLTISNVTQGRSLSSISLGSGTGGLTTKRPVAGHWRNRPIDTGTTWTEDWQAAEATVGAFRGHLSNYKTAGGAGTLNSSEIAALNAGKKLHIFWKISTSWATTVSGTRDAAIDAAADSYKARPNDQFWVTFHHEPENDLTSNGGSAGTA